jgi:glycosyltransferase involved in cell wall biosynthesis
MMVKYMPPKSPSELIEIYSSQDISVMPSFYESFGLVYAEAMSQGLPVIYTKGQGFDGQFPEGYIGYHVDADSSQNISNGILSVVENYGEISNRCPEASKIFHRYEYQMNTNLYIKAA